MVGLCRCDDKYCHHLCPEGRVFMRHSIGNLFMHGIDTGLYNSVFRTHCKKLIAFYLKQTHLFHFQESTMTVSAQRAGRISSVFLFAIGLFDLVRGAAHTFFIHWANDTFAHMDLSTNGPDQLMLLGAFGISNWLTGMIYILIALRARALSDAALLIILVAYAIGWVGLKYSGVSPDADFNGRYIMFVYFGVCAVALIWSYLDGKREIKT
jgi:hypothetical protein